MIVQGQLAFDERLLPQVDWDRQEQTLPMTRISAFMSGQQLGRNGFRRPLQADVTLELSCSGQWCGAVPEGHEMIMFLENRDGAFVLRSGACHGFAFAVTDEITRDLTRCMRGGRCKGGQD